MINSKICLTAINASFSHTSLALISLYKNLKSDNVVCRTYTINDREDKIAMSLYEEAADVYAFSVYIWNVNVVLSIANRLKKAKPECRILLGGPEVSYDAKEVLLMHPYIDYVLVGEGECSFADFCCGAEFSEIPGLVWRDGREICFNQPECIADLDGLNRLYTKEDLESYEHKMIYYETSRGCPFSCSYCLSSTLHGVRFFSLDRVFEDFRLFMDSGVPLVKLVDRTFNANPKRSADIIRFILENNKTTCFHFEVSADTLTDELIDLLRTAPENTFQLEIGVQSTYDKTIEAVHRKTDFKKLSENVKLLLENKNIHIHLDLIAGLPYEDYERFKTSFNDVFALRPQMLQLGFLKLLKGTKIRTEEEKYNYVYTETAPYEVISNDFMDYSDIVRLKGVEEVLDAFYNSGVFENSVKYILETYKDNAFDFFEELSLYLKEKAKGGGAVSQKQRYDLLFDFYSLSNTDTKPFADVLKYDFMKHNRGAYLPDWVNVRSDREFYKSFSAFLSKQGAEKYIEWIETKKLSEALKHLRAEVFMFDVSGDMQREEFVMVFDYLTDREIKIPMTEYSRVLSMPDRQIKKQA